MSFVTLHQLIALVHSYGTTVVGVVVALECLGLPVPGESLLIAAAVYAGTTQHLNILLVFAAAAGGAIVGQVVGYWIGAGVGYRLLHRYGYRIGLTTRRMAYGRALFRKHGVKVVIAARFIVLLRTIAALLAGANRMSWMRFMAANVVGSVAWAGLYGFGAYALGHQAKHLAAPAAIALSAVVLIGVVVSVLIARRHERRVMHRRRFLRQTMPSSG